MDRRYIGGDVDLTNLVSMRSGVIGNYHAPFWRAVALVRESLTLIVNAAINILAAGKSTQNLVHQTVNTGRKNRKKPKVACLASNSLKFVQKPLFDLTTVAGGQSETKNGRGGKRKTTAKVAAPNEASTHPKFVQLSLFE